MHFFKWISGGTYAKSFKICITGDIDRWNPIHLSKFENCDILRILFNLKCINFKMNIGSENNLYLL